ncbi:hypothetical protein HJC23_012973 [Cyclotella cryptica]|uniref:J domain-containing protein n=1 Tax=Cyclotella cryptica TaxID=29204 RepID=A0ABD3QFQ4_9STRA|eukprot:CCRYP_005567-RA/>CCRYP_005567-RA protein AED:0.24 eAED:0.24 QI:0/-1/0/1/-1/1/1/0/559
MCANSLPHQRNFRTIFGRTRQRPPPSRSLSCLILVAISSRLSLDGEAFSTPPTTLTPFIPRASPSLLALPRHHRPSHTYRPNTALHMTPKSKSKPPPLPNTSDPFLLLGLDASNPPTDAAEIKRAYRKRAMQYHPDVLLSTDSTEAERKAASEDFAKINAAYEMLSGGGGNVGGGGGGAEKKTSSGGYNYQPPHRRPSSASSSWTGGKSPSWEDFLPNYSEEDAKYDAGSDSFGAIFSDLLSGVAAGAAGVAGGGGIMGDLIDFLERNVDGFQSGYDDDASLERLLSSGSFEDVANEMDEADVLVSSLEKKLLSVEEEMMQLQADLGYAQKYSEKLDLEERIAELKAREKVVKGYLKKGRSRLVRLRERYKELIVKGRGGRGYDYTPSGSSSSPRDTYSGQSQSSSSAYKSPPPTSPSSNRAAETASTSSDSESKSWRTEGFSSTGRRSSSSRRSSRRRSEAGSDSTVDNSYRTSPNQRRETWEQTGPDEQAYRTRTSSSSSSASANSSSTVKPLRNEEWTPPHRRTQSSTERVAEDKRRLRELKVDDDFERLKREMGL